MDASRNVHFCPYCDDSEEFSAPSQVLLLNHVRLVHSNDPDFSIQCSFPDCSRTFVNFRTYQNHLLVHPRHGVTEDFQRTEDGIPGDNNSDTLEEPEIEVSTSSDLHETGTTGYTTTEDMQL